MPRTSKNPRGVRELERGSGVYYAVYADETGHIRREKGGTKGTAIKLYNMRKTQVLEGIKLPKNLRAKKVTFGQLAEDALEYSKAHKISYEDDEIRMKAVNEVFADRAAESITPQDIERWLLSHENWKPATANRYKALFSLVYRLGIENGKISTNPAKMVKRRRENNGRERYLTDSEEQTLREKISANCSEHLPEFEIALNTGMRRGEQFGCDWTWVNLDQRVLTVPRSKNGEKRRVYLNDAAVAAFRLLWQFSKGSGKVFGHLYQSDNTKGPREWFENCVSEASIKNFRWHDLRHTFASRLVMKGVDIRTVQELMGHKTIQMTLRYSHLAPVHQLEAVQRLCNNDGTTQNVQGRGNDADHQEEPTDSRTDSTAREHLDEKEAAIN